MAQYSWLLPVLAFMAGVLITVFIGRRWKLVDRNSETPANSPASTKDRNPRNDIAYTVLVLAGVVLIALTTTAIIMSQGNIMPIFNVLLPVIASWVGTVLAFYFGRENFESANQQVQKLVDKMSPEQEAAQPVNSAMRLLGDMKYFSIPKDKDETTVTVKDLQTFMNDNKVNRLPVLDADNKPKYIIHEPSLLKHKDLAGTSPDDSLEKFIADMKGQCKMDFGLNSGFVLVSEKTTLGEARKMMDKIPFCRDVFVTKNGTPQEPLTGWLTDSRLGKYIEMMS